MGLCNEYDNFTNYVITRDKPKACYDRKTYRRFSEITYQYKIKKTTKSRAFNNTELINNSVRKLIEQWNGMISSRV